MKNQLTSALKKKQLMLIVFNIALYVFLVVTQCTTPLFGQTHALGLVRDDNRMAQTPKSANKLRFSGVDKLAVSLKNYCPIPGDQGSIGSCVGWATGYGAQSIAFAIRDNITDKNIVTGKAMSALYTYNQILAKYGQSSGCGGIVMDDALQLMVEKGNCKLASFKPDNCRTIPDETQNIEAIQNKFKSFGLLFTESTPLTDKIARVTDALAQNKPVVFGMRVYPSFDQLRQKKWIPESGETVKGNHAMVVVGYDHLRKVFEVMNSWGTGWGDGGFAEIAYDDFAVNSFCGYEFSLTGGEAEKKLTASFHFKSYTDYDENKKEYIFSDVNTLLNNNRYEISTKKDQYFRLQADSVTKDAYIYLFSIKPDNSVEALYPKLETSFTTVKIEEIPIVRSKQSYLILPDEKGALKSDQTGVDNLCLLVSSSQIDFYQLIQSLKNSSEADVMAKLKVALGNRLIDPSNIKYAQGNMGATASVTKEHDIMPIILMAVVQ